MKELHKRKLKTHKNQPQERTAAGAHAHLRPPKSWDRFHACVHRFSTLQFLAGRASFPTLFPFLEAGQAFPHARLRLRFLQCASGENTRAGPNEARRASGRRKARTRSTPRSQEPASFPAPFLVPSEFLGREGGERRARKGGRFEVADVTSEAAAMAAEGGV